MTQLVSLQGKIYLAERSGAGRPVNPVWVGNASACTVQLQSESTTRNESFSGNRLPYGRLQRAKTATLNITLDEWTRDNLALGLYAKVIDITGGTVTGEALPSGVASGDMIQLDERFISDLTIVDSATPTPASVPFELESATAALVELGDLTGLTAPYTAAYTHAGTESYSMFAVNAPERFLMLDGINTEDGSRVLVELYRVSFDPISDLGLIHEEYGALAMTGSVLFDSQNADGSNLHGFGMISRKAEGG